MSQSDEFGDLIEDSSQPMRVVTTQATGGAQPDGPVDSKLQIPEGFSLAYGPNTKNSITATVLGAAPKQNAHGPTSVKISCVISDVSRPGGDITRAGSLFGVAMTKSEKVSTESGVDVHARLVDTGVTPVLYKSTEVISLTATLGRITQRGLKEKAVNELVPGAKIKFDDVHFAKNGTSSPWMQASEFRVVEAPRTRLEGNGAAIAALLRKGESLMIGAALNSVALRSDSAPSPEMAESFAAVQAKVGAVKEEFASKLQSVYPAYDQPADPLLVESSDLQVPPPLLFNVTKVPLDQKGVFFNDAKRAILLARQGDDEGLAGLFSGGPVVVSALLPERSYANSTLSGELHVLHTQQQYIPDVALVKPAGAQFGLKQILTFRGPTLKIPFAVLAAPFGVNERPTADFLVANLLPWATFAVVPAKSKIYGPKHGNADYIQELYIESSDQVVIDVLGTLKNAGLRLSPRTVADMYGGAHVSSPVSTSGESLVDQMSSDRKPVVSTLVNGGVASLRETPVPLTDESLNFYGVVPSASKIAQAIGNADCGTDPAVGDAAFLQAGGGSVDTCAKMLKNGELAVFAVRIKSKTTAVAME